MKPTQKVPQFAESFDLSHGVLHYVPTWQAGPEFGFLRAQALGQRGQIPTEDAGDAMASPGHETNWGGGTWGPGEGSPSYL